MPSRRWWKYPMLRNRRREERRRDQPQAVVPATTTVGVSIQREHAWEPSVRAEFELNRNGSMSNVDQISFGPYDTRRPQMIHGMRFTWPNGAVTWGALNFHGALGTRAIPSGATISFLSGMLTINVT